MDKFNTLCRSSLTARLLATLVVVVTLAPAMARAVQADRPAAVEASRVRILLVIDTQGVNAQGLGLELDGSNMRRTLEGGLKQQGLSQRYTLDILAGAQATPQAVLGYYGALKTSPAESLVFYYTGHGSMGTNGDHVLTLSGGQLSRRELGSAMARHHPRLMVLLTDCCASMPAAAAKSNAKTQAAAPGPAVAPVPGRPHPVSPPGLGNGTLLRHLLFRHEGVVDVNAVQVGREAYGDRSRGGSYFTLALTRLLQLPASRFDTNDDGFVEWAEFFPVLRWETDRVALSAKQSQRPVAFSLARPMVPRTTASATAANTEQEAPPAPDLSVPPVLPLSTSALSKGLE